MACFDRGVAKERLGDLASAMTDFNRALEINPKNLAAYDARAWARFLKNDLAGAIADATRAIQLDPGSGRAYGTRGWARYCSGDTPGALEDCGKAINLFKSESTALFLDRGMLDFISGDYDRALVSWEKAIQQDAAVQRELQVWMQRARANLQAKAQAEEWAAQGAKSPHLQFQ
jgi:tetratricopeptide (TPR) repeat protein